MIGLLVSNKVDDTAVWSAIAYILVTLGTDAEE